MSQAPQPLVINSLKTSDILEFQMNPTLNEYQRIATKSAIYPGQGTPLGLAYVALKGAGEAGEFAEHVGKAMRDDDLMHGTMVHPSGAVWSPTESPLTQARRSALIKEAGDQLWYIAAKCNELGITLEDCAAENLQKLASRSERNALRGSGDER